MPVRFDLRAVLCLAEHAVAAPASLHQPDWATVCGEPALALVVSDVVYLFSAGVPGLKGQVGVPQAVYAEPGSVPATGWTVDPHEVLDLNDLDPAYPAGGWRRPVAHLWYLPLRRPVRSPAIDLMRGAVLAGYTHATVEPTDLTIGVTRGRSATAKRYRRPVSPLPVARRGPASSRPPAWASLAG